MEFATCTYVSAISRIHVGSTTSAQVGTEAEITLVNIPQPTFPICCLFLQELVVKVGCPVEDPLQKYLTHIHSKN